MQRHAKNEAAFLLVPGVAQLINPRIGHGNLNLWRWIVLNADRQLTIRVANLGVSVVAVEVVGHIDLDAVNGEAVGKLPGADIWDARLRLAVVGHPVVFSQQLGLNQPLFPEPGSHRIDIYVQMSLVNQILQKRINVRGCILSHRTIFRINRPDAFLAQSHCRGVLTKPFGLVNRILLAIKTSIMVAVHEQSG